MADINQGIRYTIEADGSNAERSLKDIGRQAADNGQRIEKAMAGASAVTNALNGNFVGAIASLGRMTKAVSGLGRAIAAATGWIAVVGAVVSVFRKWRDSISEAKAKLEEIKAARFDEHLRKMRSAQEELNGEIERTVAAIDRQLDADARSLDIIKEKTKAQIELNRQIALEGSNDADKERINATANAQLAQTERDAASAKLAAQIAAEGNRTERLRALLAKFDGEHADRLAAFQDPARRAADIRGRAEKQAMWNWLGPVGPYEGVHSEEKRQRARLYVRNNPNAVMDAMSDDDRSVYERLQKQLAELGGILDSDWERRAKIEDAIASSEAKAKELEQQKEIDKVKTAAAVQAEKNLQNDLGKIRLAEAKRQAKELASVQQGYLVANEQQKNAEQRLAAARSAVQRAWGWYRDRDSLKSQLDEERANAEAERRYERDFESLRFRRDWRTAKNLSIDQEATRRVALAKEEESAARKAVAETAENTARAAAAVESIREAIENGGDE